MLSPKDEKRDDDDEEEDWQPLTRIGKAATQTVAKPMRPLPIAN
jgi:hypothetical protein